MWRAFLCYVSHILLIRNLTAWAEAGVLMLNTSLTVRAHSAGSHQGKGWEQFTDRVVETVDRYGGANLGEKSGVGRGVVFLAWGAWAAKRVAKLSKVRACGSSPQKEKHFAPLLSSLPIPHDPSIRRLYSIAGLTHQFIFLFLFHLISLIAIDRVLISKLSEQASHTLECSKLNLCPLRHRDAAC
jgi:hypothetical protein